MRARSTTTWTIVAALAVALLVPRARADARTTDGASWEDAARALAERPGSEGDVLLVCATDDDGACLPCTRYALTLEGEGSPAFALGACDEVTRATPVTLVDRGALFDHAHAIAPLVLPSMRVTVIAPGVRPDVGRCNAFVRAFARDVEHGGFAVLGPDRFTLRVRREDVRVAAFDDGFVVGADDDASSELAYEITATGSGEVVLSGATRLACPDAASDVARAAPTQDRAEGTRTSGIRLLPPDPVHGPAQVAEVTGVALAGAGVLTLVVYAVLFLYDWAVVSCELGGTFDPMPTSRSCSPGVALPLEVVIGGGAAIGVGALLGSIGLGIDATRGSRAPSVAGLSLGARF